MKTVFDYGEYEKLFTDERTQKIFNEVDKISKKTEIKYSLIGGMAAYIRVKNPPDDFPDLDFQLFCRVSDGKKFIEAVSKRPKFELISAGFEDDATFGVLFYDEDIQVDIFTDMEQLKPAKTSRMANVELSPVEFLIIEKLIRSKASDIRSVLDLLAFEDYDKRVLYQMARERHLSGAIRHLEYFARRIVLGKISKSGIESVVKRLTDS